MAGKAKRSSGDLQLDRIDLKILAALQRDGRITKVALAAAVNLSPSPCWERLRRLEDAGYIRGYHADVDLRLLAKITEVVVEVTLSSHQAIDFERFEAAVLTAPEVVDCVATGGGVDYIMKLVVADVDGYQRFMDGLLEAGVGVERYFGYIVTKPVKSTPPSLDDLVSGS